MKKPILLLAVLAALGFAFAGCAMDHSSSAPMTERSKSGSPGRTATQ